MPAAAVSEQERSAAGSLTELWSKVEDWTDRRLSDERGAAATRRQRNGERRTIHDVQLQLLIEPVPCRHTALYPSGVAKSSNCFD